MKFKELVAELKERDSYKEFIQENPDAIICAGFFILSSSEKEGDKVQINMFIPSKKRIATFDYPFNSSFEHEDEITHAKELTNLDLSLDLEDLKDFVREKCKIEPSKIIAILKDGIWSLTILNGMDMRRLKVNYDTKEIIEENKGLLSDFVKFTKK